MIFHIPNGETIEINSIVFDLNGTLSVYGEIKESTKVLLKQLQELEYNLYLISGDVRGNVAKLSSEIGIQHFVAKTREAKGEIIDTLNPETCAAIGNARIDIDTFIKSKIAIATLQSEGIHKDIIEHVDIIVPSIDDALRLFIDTEAFLGTMR